MYPEADIPVVQLSISANLDMLYHLEIGKALSPLLELQGKGQEGGLEGEVLLLASGGSSHNFNLFGSEKLVQQTKEWEEWLKNAIEKPTAVERNQELLKFNSHVSLTYNIPLLVVLVPLLTSSSSLPFCFFSFFLASSQDCSPS
jgi:aromatic ring-opening dioxygenase catalytic subunit (LigB family)